MASVVIADDALLVRLQLKQIFEQELGFDVVGLACDGYEAVSLYQEFRPQLLTIDLTMPNKSGQEVIEEVIASYPDARVMVISAVKDVTTVNECLHLGACGYLEKPVRIASEFVAALKEEVEAALSSKGE